MVGTTFRKELAEKGIIFCSFSEAVKEYPELVKLYLGSVVLLQAVVNPRIGQQSSSLVIVVSTLAIAALFTPLRMRIQATIDRRFYRRKYDAAKTLAALSAQMRDEVELEKLMANLLTVVEETLEARGQRLDAYERLLGDAMVGDATLFARQDTVEAALAIVDPVLQRPSPVHPYEPGSWGPPEADRLVEEVGGWNTPSAGSSDP